MAKALLVRVNTFLSGETKDEIRAEILQQYHAGGVIVLDNSFKCEVVEFDAVQVAGSSPVAVGKVEPFGELDGNTFYVVRDEYGRIVISDELMIELMAKYKSFKKPDRQQS